MGLADVALTPSGDGVRLRLRVAPGARRDALVGIHGDALKVAVRAVPEKGRANDAVLRILADVLGVPGRQLSLVAGGASRDKVVFVHGLGAEEVRARLAAALDGAAAAG